MAEVGAEREVHCLSVAAGVVSELQMFSEVVVVPCELEPKEYLELAVAVAQVHDSVVVEALKVHDSQQTEEGHQI